MSRPIASSKNWRYRKDTNQAGNWGQAVVVLLLIAALTAWFVWILWPPPRLAPYVRVLCVERYPSDQAQLPFLRNDLAALAGTFGAEASTGSGGVRATLGGGTFDVHSLKSETELASLAPYLGQLAEARSKDIAIVYIAAHGVAFDEQAYLVGSASNLEQGEQLCRVDRVLQAIQDIHDGTKLILLDAGTLHSNLRAGMPVNQFVFRLHQAMQALDDDQLWLICSHSLGQVSQASLAKQRSFFSWAVVDAFLTLRKESARDGVSLFDFYSHILRHCATQTRTREGPRQIPLLMRGGLGVVLERQLQELRPVLQQQPVFYRDQIKIAAPPPEEPAKSVEEKSAQARMLSPFPLAALWGTVLPSLGEPAAAEVPAAVAITTRIQEPDAADATAAKPIPNGSQEPSDPATPKGPPPADLETILQQNPATAAEALAQVWLLIEWLQDRDKHAWTPVDFAPNLWRVLLADVVALEQQIRFGCEPEPSMTRANLLDLKARLRLLRQGIEGGRAIDRGEISATFRAADRLLEAWNAYQPTLQALQQRVSPMTREQQQLAQQILQLQGRYRDRYFRAGEYVRWFAHNNEWAPEVGSNEITQLLNELESNQSIETYWPEIIDLTPGAKARLEELDSTQARLETAVFNVFWQQLEKAAEPRSEPFERQFLLDGLLQLTVLPPQRTWIPQRDREHELTRTAIQRRLQEVVASQTADVELVEQAWPPDLVADSLAAEHEYRLVAHWLQLVRPAASLAPNLPQLVFQTDEQGALTGKDCRAAGAQLAQVLRELADSAARDEIGAWRIASLLDRFDLVEMSSGNDLQFAARLPELKALVPPEVITFSGFPNEINLDQETSRQFVIEIVGGNRQVLPVELTMSDTDRKRVRVLAADGSEPTRLDLPIQDGKVQFDLQFQAASSEQADTEFAELEIAIPGTTKSSLVQIYPPRPDRIWLVVEQQYRRGLPEGDRWPDDSSSSMRLRPFTNFDSRFRFYLENQAGREKKVQVGFHAVQVEQNVEGVLPDALQQFHAGRHTFQGKLDARLKGAIERAIINGSLTPFFQRDNVLLQPFGQAAARQPIDFTPPKPPMGEGAAAAAPPPETIPEIPLAHGMVVHLRIDDTPPRDRFIWLEFKRISGDELFEVPEATYDKTNRRFRLLLTADAMNFDLTQPFNWRCEANPYRAPLASFEPGSLTKEIALEIPEEIALAERIDYFQNQVCLTVNQEPRAFIFEINPDEAGPIRKNIRHEISQIRILAVEGIGADSKPLPEVKLGESYVFQAAPQARVTLAADWPYVAEENSKILLTLHKPNVQTPDDLGAARLDDRQIQYVGRIEKGAFFLQAKVTDHVIEFDTVNWAGTAEFAAQMDNDPPTQSPFTTAQQRIIFDPTPPTGTFSFAQGPSRTQANVQTDEAVHFRVDSDDDAELSAVKSVHLIQDVQPNDRVDADDKVVEQPFKSQLGEWRLTQTYAKAGSYQFFARLEDLVGNSRELGPIQLEVAAAPMNAGEGAAGKTEPPPPKKYRIIVNVALGSKPLESDAKLETIDLAGIAIAGQRNGPQIVFAEVPAGTHKLTLKGLSPSRKKIVGEAELIVAEGGKRSFEVVMKYE